MRTKRLSKYIHNRGKCIVLIVLFQQFPGKDKRDFNIKRLHADNEYTHNRGKCILFIVYFSNQYTFLYSMYTEKIVIVLSMETGWPGGEGYYFTFAN